jgi:hypothetical protein
MANSEKIASVTVSVPIHSSGNVIVQKPVELDVFKDDNVYKAIPLLNTDERRLANLPEELHFEIKDGKARSLRGDRDGNMHVINDVFHYLQTNYALKLEQ